MKINMKMYTQNSCPNCMRAKFMLNNPPEGVEVNIEEINIDKNTNAKAYLESVLISNTLPTFTYESKVIGNNEEKIKINVIRGFNEGELMEALGYDLV